MAAPRWFVRGDVDGFFGLALDNLVQLLLIDVLCRVVLGFPDELLYGRVLPAVAVSLVVGNVFYAWQAMRLGREEGRDDVCALPYGINTPSVFAYVFLVMLPVKIATGDARAAWHAGLVAALGSGLIEFGGAFVADWLRRRVPRAALLSTLAGIALTLISMPFVFRTFAAPIVGLSTLAVVFLVYFGHLRFRGGVPGGLVAVALGTALAWALGVAPVGARPAAAGLHLPVPVIGDLVEALGSGYGLAYLSVILPMGLFNVVGSLQNLDSAEAAGDRYPTTPSLAANGLGTIAAALFGSCFPTTIYIGHPGWKGLGARVGYSWMNAVFVTIIALTGTVAWVAWAVPIEAGMAIVLWIGLVIAAQAFQATPRSHAPAVVVGLLPGVAAWGALMVKSGARAAGAVAAEATGQADLGVFGEALGRALTERESVFSDGLFSLEQGFIFTAMLLAGATVEVIEGRFRRAALWFVVAALLTFTGIIHGWSWGFADTALALGPGAWRIGVGYLVAAGVFAAAPLLGTRDPSAGHG